MSIFIIIYILAGMVFGIIFLSIGVPDLEGSSIKKNFPTLFNTLVFMLILTVWGPIFLYLLYKEFREFIIKIYNEYKEYRTGNYD